MRRLQVIFAAILCLIMFCPNCGAKSKQIMNSRGYVGTLPDLTKGNEVKENSENKKPSVIAIPSKEFNSEKELKPTPIEDPTFVNIILKPDKTSQYINDLVEFIPILEEINDIIEEDGNVQIFNAKVYYFNKNAEYFRDKYNGKTESYFTTYKKLMDLNTHAKSIALLRNEATKYNPYFAYENEGYIYSKNNINEQLNYLKSEIEETILILRDAK